MAARRNLSVEEVLAECRRQDGGSGGGSAPAAKPAGPIPTESSSSAEPAGESPVPAAESSAPAPAKKSGPMSVAEMLAAARAADGGAAAAKKPEPVAAESEKKAAPAKKPGAMSVEEMLAAARAEKSGPAKAAPKTPATKPAQSASKPAVEKAAPKAKPAGPKDTASILTAARGAAKPGPITKAEAAARGKEAEAPAKKKLEAPPMPAKPDYAKLPEVAAVPAPAERRGFLVALSAIFAGALFMTSSLAIGFSSLTVTTLLWLLGLARFMFPNILTEPPTRFKVGFPDEYAPGQVQTKFIAQFGVWVVRYEYDGQPQIFALQSVCTHLGCTPNWLEGEQKFKCPCHGSGFYKDGINFEGPAPRPLERFAIRLADDGQLEVDKSRRFKQEVGQWRDPASFVPV